MLLRALLAVFLFSLAIPELAQSANREWPNYQESDFVISNYKFADGETLAHLKLHYRTLGSARRNAAGEIVNGVLLLQGNTGTGANWLRPSLADELFKSGQPLDATRYFIIFPTRSGLLPTRSGGADQASPQTGSKAIFRITATTTWSTVCIGWSPSGSTLSTCASSSAIRSAVRMV
jgi:homoserine acetyltransferase